MFAQLLEEVRKLIQPDVIQQHHQDEVDLEICVQQDAKELTFATRSWTALTEMRNGNPPTTDEDLLFGLACTANGDEWWVPRTHPIGRILLNHYEIHHEYGYERTADDGALCVYNREAVRIGMHSLAKILGDASYKLIIMQQEEDLFVENNNDDDDDEENDEEKKEQ